MTPYASALAFDQPFDARRRLASANRITACLMAAVWSCLLSASVALGFLAFEVKILHWFLIPLTLCGCLIGTDMVKWMTNRLDLYDATGLIALLGYHFFFIAPLLMVTWEYRMKYLPDQPEDYRGWLGVMAILNVAAFSFTRAQSITSKPRKPGRLHLLRHDGRLPQAASGFSGCCF